jgi:hypothetical protein
VVFGVAVMIVAVTVIYFVKRRKPFIQKAETAKESAGYI